MAAAKRQKIDWITGWVQRAQLSNLTLWVPTDAFLPCMDQVSKIVAPWIVAGQGKGEFPEAVNQIGMHTDVV